MSGITSIIIADAQPVYREGLKTALAAHKDIAVVGEVSDAREMAYCLKKLKPEILILDNNPAYFKNNDVVEALKSAPDCRLIIISNQEKKWHILQSLKWNVYCYLTKECGLTDIHRAVRAAAKGEKFFCRKIMNTIVEPDGVNGAECHPALSEREIEIVKLIAFGKKNKEIADRLNVSHHTVHSHRKNIMKKLNVNSASEITAYAIKSGIIEE